MKTRQGFVSNSSSTSFCIYGLSLNENKTTDEMEIKVKKSGLKFIYGPPYSDTVYIGRELTTLRDDETGAQFKNSVKEKLEALGLTTENCCYHEEGWYDG